jgi:hypothetical protein
MIDHRRNIRRGATHRVQTDTGRPCVQNAAQSIRAAVVHDSVALATNLRPADSSGHLGHDQVDQMLNFLSRH